MTSHSEISAVATLGFSRIHCGLSEVKRNPIMPQIGKPVSSVFFLLSQAFKMLFPGILALHRGRKKARKSWGFLVHTRQMLLLSLLLHHSEHGIVLSDVLRLSHPSFMLSATYHKYFRKDFLLVLLALDTGEIV